MIHKAGVIGAGYWGPNLIRNLSRLSNSTVKTVADLDISRLEHMKSLYPEIATTTDYRELLDDHEIELIAVATPVRTHFKFAAEALQSGKHVFVEKPLASSSDEANQLITLAEQNKRKLMVGHTFIYTAAVRKMKEIIDSGEIGEIYYINAQRLNLGLFQPDINVLWDLAPHDISIILYLTGQNPATVHATGEAHINPAIEDVAVLTMKFAENLIAFVQSSWLDPDKVRKITIVGSKKMMVFDDIQPTEKIRIYDKGMKQPKHYDTYAEFPYSYKHGDIIIPKIDGSEPLRTELSHFLDCIENDTVPITDGNNGARVVRILEAAQQSLRQSCQQTIF